MSRIPADIRAVFLVLLAAGISAAIVSAATAVPKLAASAVVPTVTPVTRHIKVVPKIVPGPLDGLMTARSQALRRPIAVMVGNLYPNARPQAGLMRASIVFETLAEGGITRLMPIFLEKDASDVGPIRSARPYFVKWAAGYHAIFVHAGGSPAARQLLAQTPQVVNIDALLPHPEFIRDPQRVAPDNLFGGTVGMRAIAERRGANTAVLVEGWNRKQPLPAARREPVTHVHIDFSTPDIVSPPEYTVEYRFDASSDSYTRLVGGVPAIDRAANRPLTTQNIVVLYTPIHLIPNDPLGRVTVRAIGHGRALVFRDGVVKRGTWSKPSRDTPLTLTGSGGLPIRLDPGRTWVEATVPGNATWGTR